MLNIFGVAFPICFTIFYFALNGALKYFLHAIFVDAPAAKGDAKGNFSNSLFRWIRNMFAANSLKYQVICIFVILFILVSLKLIHREYWHNFSKHLPSEKNLLRLSTISIIFIAFLINAYITNGKKELFYGGIHAMTVYILSWVYFLPVVSIVAVYLWKLKVNRESMTIFILCLGMIWSDGSSGGIDWYGVAIPIATMTALLTQHFWKEKIFDIVVLLIVSGLSVGVINSWADDTYNWWGLSAGSSYAATDKINFGLAKGIHVDPKVGAVYGEINKQLTGLGSCRQSMVAFPSTPMLILDAQGKIANTTATYWFDVVSQAQVLHDLNAFRNHTPSVFIVLGLPKAVWEGHAQAFNDGKVYNQQLLLNFIQSLTAKGYKTTNYNLPDSPGFFYSIYVKQNC